MKIKDGLILRKVANQYVVVPTGKRTKEVPNLVCISPSAAYLWEFMQNREFTVEDLTNQIMDFFTGVTREEAEQDIWKFLDVLKKGGILEAEPGEEANKSGRLHVVVPNDPE